MYKYHPVTLVTMILNVLFKCLQVPVPVVWKSVNLRDSPQNFHNKCSGAGGLEISQSPRLSAKLPQQLRVSDCGGADAEAVTDQTKK